VLLDGEDVTGQTPMELIEKGLAYIPEERNRDVMIEDFSVAENLIMRDLDQEPYSKRSVFNFNAVDDRSDKLVQQFDVKTPALDTPMKNLSGGNAQKVILARELSRHPKVFTASQATRGVDIGATEYIHDLVIGQRDTGTVTLLISEDLDEIMALSDRFA
jgi:simple sugar transport system ATP-binding protein